MKKCFYVLLPLVAFAAAAITCPVIAQEGKGATSKENGVSVKVQDNKLTITLANGEEKVINLDELTNKDGHNTFKQEVIVTDSKDGEQKATINAWIVGDDGKKEIIALDNLTGEIAGSIIVTGDGGGAGGGLIRTDGSGTLFIPSTRQGESQDNAFEFETESDLGKYMIGVSCEEVPLALRAQLKLDESAGLLVTATFEDTPAYETLKVHDVILKVNGENVNSLEGLIKEVQDSGEAEEAMKLVVLRDGDDIKVKLAPVERKNASLTELDLHVLAPEMRIQLHNHLLEGGKLDGAAELHVVPHIQGTGDLRLVPRLSGAAGMIVPRTKNGGEGHSDLADQIDELRRQIEELKEMIKNK